MERAAPTDVLLIEDDPADIYVINRIVAEYEHELRLWVIPDGVEACRFLQKAPPFTADTPTPALIVLDLKLPQLDGTLLLPQIRQLPAHRATPVVIFSSTPKEREGARCFALGATAYVQKSLDLDGFRTDLQRLLQHWLP